MESKVQNNNLKVGLICLFGFLSAVAFCLIISAVSKNNTPSYTVQNLVIDTSATNVEKGQEELQSRQVNFFGIVDGSMSKSAPLLLQNPAINDDIFMKYIVIDEDTNKAIFETDLIESGKFVEWYPGETLEVGVHHLTFTEQPYYQVEGSDGWLPLTTGNNSVVIELTE